MAGTRVQSCDRHGSGTLHPGQVLGGILPLLPPPLDVPTFAARCLYVSNDARDPSSERWNCGREICTIIYIYMYIYVCVYVYTYIYICICSYHCDINVQTMIRGLTRNKPAPSNRLMGLDSCSIAQAHRHVSFFLPKRPCMLWGQSSHRD